MIEALTGLTVFSGLSQMATGSANARAMETQAAQVGKINALNEIMEAGNAASALSGQRAKEASSGLTDTTGTVMRKVYTDYLRDKEVRKYNAAIEAQQLRTQAGITRTEGFASGLGTIGGGLLRFNRLQTPKGTE